MEDSLTTLERYVNEKTPRYIIIQVSADGLCVIRSFQFKICYQDEVTIEEVITK